MTFTFIDLFSGAGGLTAGLVATGLLSPSLAVELDEAGADTYVANFGEHVFRGDVANVRRFPQVDLVAGGPPCQGFSPLGTQTKDDERNKLWREYLRALKSAKPTVFVMENVPELLRSQEYADFRTMARLSGYTVEARVLNAADFGTAQRRRRAIVIGVRGGEPLFPAPTHSDPAKSGILSHWLTVRDAFDAVPLVPDCEPPRPGRFTSRELHFGRTPRAESLERYRTVPPGGNRFDLFRSRPDLTPRCWAKKPTGSTDIFGRLWWDRPSVTIRTEFFKPEKGRYLHPEEDRPITHFEACRLQGFDDSFIWTGSKIGIARQIGNAVPVPLARAIGEVTVRMLQGDRGSQPIHQGELIAV